MQLLLFCRGANLSGSEVTKKQKGMNGELTWVKVRNVNERVDQWLEIIFCEATGQLPPLRFGPWSTHILIYPSQLALHTVALLGQFAP